MHRGGKRASGQTILTKKSHQSLLRDQALGEGRKGEQTIAARQEPIIDPPWLKFEKCSPLLDREATTDKALVRARSNEAQALKSGYESLKGDAPKISLLKKQTGGGTTRSLGRCFPSAF